VDKCSNNENADFISSWSGIPMRNTPQAHESEFGMTARQSRVCDALLRSGRSVEELAAIPLGALKGDPDVTRCIELRAQLGIDASPGSPAFVLADGSALDAAGLARFVRVARLVRLSLEGNAGFCRSLLATRYGIPDPEEVAVA